MDIYHGHLVRVLHLCTDQTMTAALEKMELIEDPREYLKQIHINFGYDIEPVSELLFVPSPTALNVSSLLRAISCIIKGI